MSAVPQWKRLKTQLIEDVRYGAPPDYIELTPVECVQWIDEESEHLIGYEMLDAMGEAYMRDKTRDRYNLLCTRLMDGSMTADELCEYRDMHRAALIDMCSKWARREVEKESPL